jgi:peptidoglycan/xylan/chitin deacetylase (PgdA/CDA1 family)
MTDYRTSTPQMPSRDLIGYGGNLPSVKWPNGALLAVSLVVNFEEGAESSIEAGDPAGEQTGEVTTIIRPGVRDIGQEQLFAYGMRAGVWRVLDALEQYKMKATFMMCGLAVQRAPEIARHVVAQGHEPACHGWRWRPHSDFTSADEERQSLQRCIDVIESVTSVRPVGFFCRGSQSEFTRDLLIDLGFEYDNNAFDDDFPYWATGASGREILAVPYAKDTNDQKFYQPNGFVTPNEFIEYVRGAIDALLIEGKRGYPKMLTIGFHLRIVGRPGRISAFVDTLDYLKRLGDAVWIARRCDIAQVWRTAFPSSKR